MALGNVMQSAGAVVRAESELNLLNNENRKRLRTESTLSTSRTQEKDGRAAEAEQSVKKVNDLVFQKNSAQAAEDAAALGVWSALFGAVSGVAGAWDGDTFGTIIAGVQGFFNVMGAYMAYLGAAAEVDMLNEQFGFKSAEAKQDESATQALDANPAL